MSNQTEFTRYAVRNGATFLRHHKGFTYRTGNFAAFTENFQHARLYTRRIDAENAARWYGGAVVEVKVTLA